MGDNKYGHIAGQEWMTHWETIIDLTENLSFSGGNAVHNIVLATYIGRDDLAMNYDLYHLNRAFFFIDRCIEQEKTRQDSLSVSGGDPINPGHYRFDNGAEVIDTTELLTFCGGNSVKYIARATRVDGRVKGRPLEDLEKARWYVLRDIDRAQREKDAQNDNLESFKRNLQEHNEDQARKLTETVEWEKTQE